MTILLVDTNQQALDREARRLSKRQSGIVVMFYSNAEDAESFARTHDVDVVYTREKLLGTTGMELIKKILRFRPTAECHVLQNNEEIPFARFSGDDPAYLESDEENTVFPPEGGSFRDRVVAKQNRDKVLWAALYDGFMEKGGRGDYE